MKLLQHLLKSKEMSFDLLLTTIFIEITWHFVWILSEYTIQVAEECRCTTGWLIEQAIDASLLTVTFTSA